MTLSFEMVGPAISLGLACVGSSVGCCIAGMASAAAMTRTEEGHGKFIGLAAAPSSQVIYGFALMYIMAGKIRGGTLSPIDAMAIGLFSGFAIMMSAIFQGRVAASGIEASLKTPAIYGKTWVSVGMIESFALFAFVFALLII